MRRVVISAMLFVASASWADGFLVRGTTKSCHDFLALDHIMNGENPAPFFQDWSAQDFDAAVDWARGCVNSSWQFSAYSGANREPMLRAMQRRWQAARAQGESNSRAQKQLQDQIAAQEAQRKAQAETIAADEQNRSADLNDARESREAAERSKQKFADMQAAELATVAECRSTHQYKLYEAQESVINSREELAAQKDGLLQQRRIAAVSGVRDLSEERRLGEWAVGYADSIREYFAEYKKLGGKASSPQQVTHKLTDPCT